jgi:hypothetical protein
MSTVRNVVKKIFELPPRETHPEILGKNGDGTHRVLSDWIKLIGHEQFNKLFAGDDDLKVQISTAEPIVVMHDLELFITLKSQGYTIEGFVHTDLNVLDKVYQTNIKCMQYVAGGTMIGYRQSQPIDWSKSTAMGNTAFSITHEMIPTIISQKPKKIKLIVQADFTTAIAGRNGHGEGVATREQLLNYGLKSILFLPAGWFKRIDRNGKENTAGINAVYFECEAGYDGDITVSCYNTKKSYTATRSSKYFPRTRDAYKMLQLDPKMTSTYTYRFGSKSMVKNSKLTTNKFFVSIPHGAEMQAKQKQKTGKWDDNGSTPLLQFARTLQTVPSITATDSQLRAHEPAHTDDNVGVYDCFVHSFATQLERDSFLSLCHSYYFYTTFSDFVFKLGRYSGPAMSQIPDFPLDRIWDDNKIETWVDNEAKKQGI